ncbi:DUF1295-domain-containing protein [Ophiocordyceps camponoti-floridani]|uniref:DUF1295-domain-containing protein n=1 Tax=Ophiocordyceps camponoti-floridani TaxID=2030778 RepID=A0A8H4QE94_9HYPO|nr:DUF1295-domain-containing protein [Ophiocordyceps camponoti-floridani]
MYEVHSSTTLLPTALTAFALQAAVGIPSAAAATERFYDISGSATVLAVGALGLCLPSLRAEGRWVGWRAVLAGRAWGQIAVTAMAVVWTCRLGSYLFQRVLSEGKDSRFDKMRERPALMLAAFAAQACWVAAIMTPVIALNACPPTALPPLGAIQALGFILWAGGMTLEVVADGQKGKWLQGRRQKQHDEPFLSSGLYSFCRFPNYLGEITLWSGVATVSAAALASPSAQAALGLRGGMGVLVTTGLAALSPAMTAFLLTCVSGIPLSEGKYDERFGHREDYKAWRRGTARLLPGIY